MTAAEPHLGRLVADTIRRRIRAGVYPVGSRIPTYRSMAGELGVSLTPVRAAYAMLQRAGVLVGEPGRGVFVARVPERDAPLPPALPAQVARLQERVDAQEAILAELRAEIERLRATAG